MKQGVYGQGLLGNFREFHSVRVNYRVSSNPKNWELLGNLLGKSPPSWAVVHRCTIEQSLDRVKAKKFIHFFSFMAISFSQNMIYKPQKYW